MTTPAVPHDPVATAVAAALADGRLGTPVFVRLLVTGLARAEDLVPTLARALAAVRTWTGQAVQEMTPLGDPAGGQLTLTVSLQGGAVTLVSVSIGGSEPAAGLTLLGTRGSLALDYPAAADAVVPFPADKPDPALLAALARAVATGQPQDLSDRGAAW